MKRILIIFGTRPEAIKMAPVVHALRKEIQFEVKVCVTAQHRSMLDQVLNIFDIEPDIDLNLMTKSQTLEGVSVRILESISKVLDEWHPNIVLVHGDTTTTSMASLACFYKRIPIGHVEAGLRTGNIFSPWPEELNRRLTALVAQLHFAPTASAAKNLLDEKVPPENIVITGNTVIDALLSTTKKLALDAALSAPLIERFNFINSQRKLLLVTGHRRENFGDGMNEICNALLTLSNRDDLEIIYAAHLNPNVQGPVESKLSNKENIHIIPPQDYLSFVYLMTKSHIILTDSGGIQEEAPSLGKPVLVMRDSTERPEAINAGTAILVGANASNIITKVNFLMDNTDAYEKMSAYSNPYGDGHSSAIITQSIKNFLAKYY